MNHQPRRTNLRLRTFDYRSPGPYFVTICLYHRQPRFGVVENERVILSPAGEMIADAWTTIVQRFGVGPDAFIVMPDHMHGILTLPLGTDSSPAPSLGRVIGAFKSLSTKLYRDGVSAQGWPRFQEYFWGQTTTSTSFETIAISRRSGSTSSGIRGDGERRWGWQELLMECGASKAAIKAAATESWTPRPALQGQRFA